MRTLSQHLSLYAQYHRDQRNIYTHFAGIPLIVISVIALLSFPLGGWLPLPDGLTAAHLVLGVVALFYLYLNIGFGLLMLGFLALCSWLAAQLTAIAGGYPLLAAAAVFVVGWVLQFIGHYFEGKKPAFVDDLSGLVIGPLFVVAEWCFLCGIAKQLEATIIAEAGPVRR
jgi:uncharacterized membrane protein YGL010W